MTGRSLMVPFLVVGSACAQFNPGTAIATGQVRVRVSFTNNSECVPTTRVALEANSGVTFSESTVNSQCIASFFDVPAGNYSVQIVGADLSDAGRAEVALSPGMAAEVDVSARRMGESDVSQSTAALAFVSVSELGVPSNARREFEKASRLISKHDWPKASERLQKAIAIYPRFAAAYNNLGAVYMRTGEGTKARAALESAIALDDHIAASYLNLARLSFRAKEYPAVEAYVQRVLTLAAPDSELLALLGVAQFEDRRFDSAIETSRLAHRSQLSRHAFLHLVAARAQDAQGKTDASVSEELQQYLNEDPNGERAEEVKKALALMGTQPTSQ